MKAWAEGPKIPLLIAEELLWDLNTSLSIFCFQVFKTQETTWEPDKETMSSAGERCDFYWSISTLTYTEQKQNTHGRTWRRENTVYHPVSKANAAPRHPRFERPRNAQVNLEVKASFWRSFETPPTSGDPSWAFFLITLITSKNHTNETSTHKLFPWKQQATLEAKMTFRWASAQSLGFSKARWDKGRQQGSCW